MSVLLNLLCLLGGAAVLFAGAAKHSRIRRTVTALLVTVALLPCISIDDDIVSIGRLVVSHDVRATADDAQTAVQYTGGALERMLEELEHFQPAPLSGFLVALLFAGFVSTAGFVERDVLLTHRSGRSPPRV
jgi:hypothetical protein